MPEKNHRIQKQILSYLLTMMLVLNIFLPSGAHAQGTEYAHDQTVQMMEDITSSLEVQGQTTDFVDGQEITADKLIKFGLNFSFKDLTSKNLTLQDSFNFTIVDGFILPDPIDPKDIFIEGLTSPIGKLKLYNSNNNSIMANITFVQEDNEEIRQAFTNADFINFSIEGWMKYGKMAWDVEAGGKSANFWENNFILKPNTPNNNYGVKKSGQLIDQTTSDPKIEWTISFDAKDADTQKVSSLEGYKFSDDLSDVGEYVENSFRVNDTPAAPSQGSTFEYYFTKEDTLNDKGNLRDKIEVKFQTKVPKEKFYQNGKIQNQAGLFRGSDRVQGSDLVEIDLTSQWIKKNGGIESIAYFLPNGEIQRIDRTATWTIEINKDKALLTNAVVTDVLSGGMVKGKDSGDPVPSNSSKQTFQKAYLEVSDGKGGWKEAETDRLKTWSTEPEGGRYELPTPLNEYVRLKIVSTISGAPKDFMGNGIATVIYQNQASITWNGLNAPHESKPVEVEFKFNSIKENYSKYVLPKGNIEWDITVEERTQEIQDLKFYNMVTFGDVPLDVNTLTTSDGRPLPGGFANGYGGDNGNLQGLGQRFVPNTLKRTTIGKTNDPLPSEIIDLYQNGKVVGQLLVVSGITDTNRETFKVQTEIVSKKLQNFNGSSSDDASKITNSSTLYTGSTKLDHATAKADRKSGLVHKEFLKRGAEVDLNRSVNDLSKITRNEDAAFDYDEKATIYRLSINSFGYDWSERKYFENGDMQSHGPVTITDTLPDGWEFKNFKGTDKKYILYRSAEIPYIDTTPSKNDTELQNKTTRVLLSDITIENSIQKAMIKNDPAPTTETMGSVEPVISDDGKTITFTFNSLDRAAVILVKAGPTDAKAKEIFKVNGSTNVTNTLSFATKTKNAPESTLISQRSTLDDKIKSAVFWKDIKMRDKTRYDITDDGAMQWTLYYHSYDIKQDPGTEIRVEDQLPVYLKLPVTTEGKLEDGAVTIKKRVLSNGIYKDGSDITADHLQYIKYDPKDNKLVFNVPVQANGTVDSYRIDYKTYLLKGSAGEKFHNKAALFFTEISPQGKDTINISDQKSITLTDALVKASLGKNATLAIHKVDASDPRNKLSAARFSLFVKAENNAQPTLFDTAVTDSNGKVVFSGLPVGKYQLRELNAPDGFSVIDTVLDITVTRQSNGQGVVEIAAPDPNPNNIISEIVRENNTQFTKLTIPNSRKPDYAGSLKVTKILTDIPVDQNKDFEFTMAITNNGVTDLPESFDYVIYNNNSAVKTDKIRSGDIFKLKHGEYASIDGIPHGVTVTVTENSDGYNTKIDTKNAVGELASVNGNSASLDVKVGAELEMTFNNTKTVPAPPGGGTPAPANDPTTGKLEISKTIEGASADQQKAFSFQVFFEGDSKYTLTKGTAPNGVEVQNGSIFELKHGEKATIHNLPKDLKVTVTELTASMAGYTVKEASISNTIESGQIAKATFINTKTADHAVGNLEIDKTVQGPNGDLKQDFEFTAIFADGKTYKAIKVDPKGTASEIDLANNGKFTLKHGEKLTIQNLPKDLEVTITEKMYIDYDVTPNITQSKNIVGNTTVYLSFTNTKDAPPSGGGNSGGGNGGGGNSGGGGGNRGDHPSPVRPDSPKDPQRPQSPDKPKDPERPQDPDRSKTPEQPKTPDDPITPEAPKVPDPQQPSALPRTNDPSNGRSHTRPSGPNSEDILDDDSAKAGLDKQRKNKDMNKPSKVAGAPKTGIIGSGETIRNFLTYGTILMLSILIADEYRRRK